MEEGVAPMNCDKCGREMFFDTEDSVWRHETLSDGSEPVDCPMVNKTGKDLDRGDDETRAQLADPERIRREAIGAWVQNHPLRGTKTNAADGFRTLGYISALDDAAAAGESTVTGGPEASIDQQPFPIRCPGGYVSFDDPRVGPDRAACPSCGRVIGFHRITGRFHNHNRAVTGEAQP